MPLEMQKFPWKVRCSRLIPRIPQIWKSHRRRKPALKHRLTNWCNFRECDIAGPCFGNTSSGLKLTIRRLITRHRSKVAVVRMKPYKKPHPPKRSSTPMPRTPRTGNRFHGAAARSRNDSGLRTRPTPHHTYAAAHARKNKGLAIGATSLQWLWNGIARTTARHAQKIIQPVNESALRLPDKALRWYRAKK
jgi:hypothetical protein